VAEASELLRFVRAIGRLKTLRRQGRIDRGGRQTASVAEQSFRVALRAGVGAPGTPAPAGAL